MPFWSLAPAHCTDTTVLVDQTLIVCVELPMLVGPMGASLSTRNGALVTASLQFAPSQARSRTRVFVLSVSAGLLVVLQTRVSLLVAVAPAFVVAILPI